MGIGNDSAKAPAQNDDQSNQSRRGKGDALANAPAGRCREGHRRDSRQRESSRIRLLKAESKLLRSP